MGGLLAPPGDVTALTAAAAALLTDAPRRRAMGRAAARHAARSDAPDELSLTQPRPYPYPIPTTLTLALTLTL